MKEKWMAPKTVIEEFTPNNYCTICWGVSCDWSASNTYEQNHGYWDNGNVSHAADHCGTLTNQVLRDYNNDGKADEMTERGTDGLGTLTCTIYTNSNYTRIRDINTVTSESGTIYWTTKAGKRTWHHQGTVVPTIPGHPNMS